MKQLFSTLIILIFGISQINAQISLHGTVSIQNSKTETGKTEYVPNAQVECDKGQSAKAQPKTSDSEGKFTLEVDGKKDMQIAISVTPKGKYQNYVVVNEDKIKDITLGRLRPVSVYICKRDELEQRQAKMVDVNMKRYQDQIKLLQKELNELKAKYDYDNTRYKLLENQIDSLSKAEKDMYSLIKEWAESLTKINLDDESENYVKAYKCFAASYLDSIKYYLPDEWLEQRTKQALRQKEEGKQQIEIGQVLTEAGQQNVEIADAELADITKSWILKAKAEALNNQYEQAISYYEKAINIDSLNVYNIFEFAKYLYSIREYSKAEIYYQKCLEICRALEKENPKAYLPDIAEVLNNLAVLHYTINEYSKAIEEYEEALKIFKELMTGNKMKNLIPLMITSGLTLLIAIVALILSLIKKNKRIKLATLFLFLIFIGLTCWTICNFVNKSYDTDKPKAYLQRLAGTLNNLAVLHCTINEYPKALEELEEALEIRRKLAEENPKAYLPDVAATLNNLGLLYWNIDEYSKALEVYKEALEISRKLAEENPKVYLPDVARTLNNLTILYINISEYYPFVLILALDDCEEALEIYRKLAEDNPKTYLPDVAATLNNLAILYRNIKEYPKALEAYEEALEIRRKLAEENPRAYLPNVAQILNNLSIFYQIAIPNKELSLKYAREAIEVLGKCSYTSFVKKELEKAKWVIEEWNNE